MLTVKRFFWLVYLVAGLLSGPVYAETVLVGQSAPLFTLYDHDGSQFSLQDRRNQGWTVLYFYPKAGTPGCTAQACAFRDAIKLIRDQNAEVYGISTDDVGDLKAFHQEHKLTFILLSDLDATVTGLYGAKMPVLDFAKRWTFILDPELTIRQIETDVDPVLDAVRVAKALRHFQSATAQ
jgi:peroxiredoxin Q/BCP